MTKKKIRRKLLFQLAKDFRLSLREANILRKILLKGDCDNLYTEELKLSPILKSCPDRGLDLGALVGVRTPVGEFSLEELRSKYLIFKKVEK